MEISKTENEDAEKYKKSLLDCELLSKGTFEELGLAKSIINTLHELGFKSPSIIQQKSVPEIEKNNDVAFQSHSGSGKTIAFLIGALKRIDLEDKVTQVIIISPTRDLSRQIYGVLEQFKANTPFTSLLALNDTVGRSSNAITEQILVGPPGTIKSVIQGRIDTRKIKMIILDEADALLSEDMGTQTISAVKRVPKKQLVLFSATFSIVLKKIISTLSKDIKTFYLEEDNLKPTNIAQFYMKVDERAKSKTLIDLYSMLAVGQSIVFVQTRAKAEKVVEYLKSDGFDAQLLHGMQEPSERDEVIKSYKEGRIKVLVTTNVLSRGFDVPQLNLAINYDIPRGVSGSVDIETYIHRIGRTGRFNRQGVSITFITNQRDTEDLMIIQKAVSHPIKYTTLSALNTALTEQMEKE